MAVTYQLLNNPTTVLELDESGRKWSIPITDPKYQAFLAGGGIPAPADPPAPRYVTVGALGEHRVRTTDAPPTEIARFTVPTNTEYTGLLRIRGITDDLGNLRNIQAVVSVGRAAGNVAIIPTRVGAATATIVADHAIGSGGAWPLPSITVDNSNGKHDLVLTVTGAVSTGINWLLTGYFETFSPSG